MKTILPLLVISVLLGCFVVYTHNEICALKIDGLEKQHKTDSLALRKLNQRYLEANGQLIRIGQSSRWAMFLKAYGDSAEYYIPTSKNK